ncbi:MAG: uroporphyrinogen-III synthase [Rhodocyclaceae bacterium]
MAAAVGAAPLAGRRVVVTRPEAQAGALAAGIVAAGGEPIMFPVLAIADVEDIRPIVDVADRLDQFHLAIFISPNAVNKALSIVLARRVWPEHVRVACVGKSSERELARRGFRDVIAPQGRFDSEALLELAPLQASEVAGRRVVIFRGDGGRELLGDTLLARGAVLEYAECYRRGKPQIDPAPLLTRWARGEIDALSATSSEGLRNLFDMVGKIGQEWLRNSVLFVPHERIAQEAQRLGMQQVVLSGPGDDGLLSAMIAYFTQHAAPR